MATGEFTPTPGAGWKPYAALYGPDAIFWTGVATTGAGVAGSHWDEFKDYVASHTSSADAGLPPPSLKRTGP
jgi:hypothetical protein